MGSLVAVGELIMAVMIVPLLIGASIGSLYFLASHYSNYDKPWVLYIMVATSWFIGYSAGLPLADNPLALLVSLIASAVGVVTLDAVNASTIEGREPPPILNWIVRLIESIRSGRG